MVQRPKHEYWCTETDRKNIDNIINDKGVGMGETDGKI